MSITNFYYFNNNILYKRYNESDVLDDNGKEDTADGGDVKAVANGYMEIKSTCEELPIAEGDALVCLFPDEIEKLLMLPSRARTLFRARVEREPLDIDVELTRGSYKITPPEYIFPNEERIAELVRLAADGKSPRIRECASAYRRLIAVGKEEVTVCSVDSLMNRIIKLTKAVKGYTIKSVSARKRRSTPRIRCREENFYRMIVTAISAAFAMTDGDNVKMKYRVANRVASFRAVFRYGLPDDIKEQLLSGEYGDCSFESEYGEVCLMLSYIRHNCHLYGYFLTLEETGKDGISLCITLPLIKSASSAMAIRECVDEMWLKELIERMLP